MLLPPPPRAMQPSSCPQQLASRRELTSHPISRLSTIGNRPSFTPSTVEGALPSSHARQCNALSSRQTKRQPATVESRIQYICWIAESWLSGRGRSKSRPRRDLLEGGLHSSGWWWGEQRWTDRLAGRSSVCINSYHTSVIVYARRTRLSNGCRMCFQGNAMHIVRPPIDRLIAEMVQKGAKGEDENKSKPQPPCQH